MHIHTLIGNFRGHKVILIHVMAKMLMKVIIFGLLIPFDAMGPSALCNDFNS